MQPHDVRLLQSDSRITQALVVSLSGYFPSIQAVNSLDELRGVLAKSGSSVVILDLEMAPLRDVAALVRDFPEVTVICNHRAPDDKLWVETMNAGAADCCPSDDTAGILHAVVATTSARHAA